MARLKVPVLYGVLYQCAGMTKVCLIISVQFHVKLWLLNYCTIYIHHIDLTFPAIPVWMGLSHRDQFANQ